MTAEAILLISSLGFWAFFGRRRFLVAKKDLSQLNQTWASFFIRSGSILGQIFADVFASFKLPGVFDNNN